MATGSQPDHDCYRAIVLRNRGAELLAVPTECGFGLPSVDIPRWQRVAVNLAGALKREWGCEAICLFTPVNESSCESKAVYWQVMECCHNSHTLSVPAVWIPVSSLSAESLADSADHVALRKSLDLLGMPPDDSQPFLQLGWFQELQAWVEEVSQQLGVKLTGKFCQFNASPSFSLIRFETTGGALWFKAVGEPNQHEFPITVALSRCLTQFVPTVIAIRPAWCGWLMQDAGTPISEIIPTLDVWRQIAADLAKLQIDSIPQSQALLRAGARDLRKPKLLDLVDPFLDSMDRLMRQQIKPSPPPLSPKEIFELSVTLKDALAGLDQIHFPTTLGHSDFNPGNILWRGNGSVFTDWAEAHVGHPFLTFEYLLSHLRKDCSEIAGFEDFIRSAYTQPWRYIVPAQSIAEAAVLSPLVAVFAFAVSLNSWHSPKSHDQQALSYLRSLTRRMKREMELLEARRMSCLRS